MASLVGGNWAIKYKAKAEEQRLETCSYLTMTKSSQYGHVHAVPTCGSEFAVSLNYIPKYYLKKKKKTQPLTMGRGCKAPW